MSQKILFPFLFFFTVSCAKGPGKEAVIDNTLLTIMANMIESNVTLLLDNTVSRLNIPCSGGSGTMAVNDAAYGTIDPGQNNLSINTTVDFNQCLIKVCDRKKMTTLNGNGLFSIGITATVQTGSTTLSDIALTVTSSGLHYTGELEGDFSYSYELTGTLSRDTFGGIIIREATPPNPLNYKNKFYNANDLSSLSDGC